MEYVITLVHGTFAPEAEWTIEEKSKLCAYLRKKLQPAEVQFERLQWTGDNEQSARLNAGTELATKLQKLTDDNKPPAKHFVIAHSHGGNIALYALRDESLQERIAGVICLSTPFLVARERVLGEAGLNSLLALTTVLLFALAWFFSSFIQDAFVSSFACLLVFVLFLIPVIYLRVIWEQRAKDLLPQFTLPNLGEKEPLVIRSSGDEASGLLGSVQFMAWLSTKFWIVVNNITETYKERTERHFWYYAIPSAILLIVLAWAWTQTDESSLLRWVVGSTLVAVALLTAWAVLQFHFSVLLQALVGGLGLLLTAVLVVPLWIFGKEMAFNCLLIDISAEATPPGRSRVYHLPAQVGNAQQAQEINTQTLTASKRNKSLSVLDKLFPRLSHSETYERQEAWDCIVEWIQTRGTEH